MKKYIKGSLTVEASFVMTTTVLVALIMLSLWIYKFQLCWYTQAANECLLTGSNFAVLNEQSYMELTKSKWDNIKEENYLKPKDLVVQIEEKKSEICIEINGSVPLMGKKTLEMYIEQRIGIVKPVKFIRTMDAVQEVVGK